MKYRFGDTFSSELAINYNDFDLPVPNGQFTANLARLRLSYSFTPKILLEALVQYNDVDEVLGSNIRFSWLQWKCTCWKWRKEEPTGSASGLGGVLRNGRWRDQEALPGG